MQEYIILLMYVIGNGQHNQYHNCINYDVQVVWHSATQIHMVDIPPYLTCTFCVLIIFTTACQVIPSEQACFLLLPQLHPIMAYSLILHQQLERCPFLQCFLLLVQVCTTCDLS